MTGQTPTKILLDESELPTQWYNVIPDLPSPPPPPLHPGHARARRSRGPPPAVPDGADRAGGDLGQLRRHPRWGAGRLPPVAAEPAVPRPSPRAAARHPRQDLLQVRGREPGRLAQAEHVGAAGVLQPPGGHPEADHRDRRRPVGHRPRVRLCPVRHRLRGVAGRRVLSLEALPPHDDGDLRRHAALQPVRRHRVRPFAARRRTPTTPAASASPSRRRSPSPPPIPTPATRWAASSTTCCCTRRSSARRRCCSWPRSARCPTCSSAAPAAARTSAGCRSRSCARSSPGGWTRRSAASSPPPARA